MPGTLVVRCEPCQDTTWIHTDAGVRRCRCFVERLQTHADGTPLEFRTALLENYRALAGNEAAVRAAVGFAKNGRDLYLSGSVGSGKTRLACTLLNEQHKAGVRGLFARIPMLLLKLQPQGTDEARAESDRLLQRLLTVPVLVLDDIGAERDSASDFTRRTLLTVYEERGDQGHRTIWTSNLRLDPDPKQQQNKQPTLGEFMGDDRLASRIAGRAQLVHLSTPDQRLQRRRGEQ